MREEKYSEAIDHFNQAYSFYSSQGIQRSIGYNMLSRADALWRMGRYDDAKPLLDQASAIADKPGGELKQLSLAIKLNASEMVLSQELFADAKSRAQVVIEQSGTEFSNAALGAKIVVAGAESYSGGAAAAKRTATDVLEMARKLNDPSQLANAELTLAEAMLLANDAGSAGMYAEHAAAVFGQLNQTASQWRALLVVAAIKQKTGDKTAAREYSVRAKESLSKLEQRWGGDNYQNYLRRPDVRRFVNQLDQLTSAE